MDLRLITVCSPTLETTTSAPGSMHRLQNICPAKRSCIHRNCLTPPTDADCGKCLLHRLFRDSHLRADRNGGKRVGNGKQTRQIYAHNAMSLESLLKTLRKYHPKRLICLFGCGGNRARDRRFQMGEVSGRLADLTVITSDNPRDEEPQAILDDIRTGIGKTEGDAWIIVDPYV